MLDIIVLVIVGLSALFGFYKGFVIEIFALGGIAVGIVVANASYASLGETLLRFIASSQIANAVAYALIFLIAMTAVIIVGRVFDKFVRLIFLGWLNRLLGLVFGFTKGALLAALLLLLLTLALPPQHELIAKSLLRPYFDYAYALVPEHFKQQLIEKGKEMERYLKEKAGS